MPRKRIAALLVIYLAAVSEAHAFDRSYFFSGFGEGNRTCEQFIAAREAEVAAHKVRGGPENAQYTLPYAAMYAFVEGWVTAADLFLPNTYSLFPGGLGPAIEWLTTYCQRNPTKKLAAALPMLWLENFPARQQAKPE